MFQFVLRIFIFAVCSNHIIQ